MSDDRLGILEQRRIEAAFAKGIYEEMAAELGAARAKAILSRAVVKLAKATAAEMAKEAPDGEPSLAHFIALQPLWTKGDALRIDTLHKDDTRYDFNVTPFSPATATAPSARATTPSSSSNAPRPSWAAPPIATSATAWRSERAMSGYVATDGGAYERSMGRWSRRLAEPFLDTLALPRGATVLDAGCGTGALAEAIAARDATARITGLDISEAFLAAARARVPGAAFRTGDITALPDPDATYDAALSLLVLQFVPDRARAAAELARVRARYFADPVGAPGRLGALLAAAGLRDVAERDLMIRQDFSDFADWWEPWLTGQGIAGAFVAALPAADRPRVEALARRAYLAGGPDGPRSFVAVARLATARKPD